MQTVFISAPYSSKSDVLRQENVIRAKSAAEQLIKMGYRPICPHMIYTHAVEAEVGWGGVMEACREWVHDAELVLFLDGWVESRGCRFEHDFALAAGHVKNKSIIYGLENMPNAHL